MLGLNFGRWTKERKEQMQEYISLQVAKQRQEHSYKLSSEQSAKV